MSALDPEYQNEEPFTIGISTPFELQSFLALMQACPDLSAAQKLFTGEKFIMRKVTIHTQTPANRLHVARTVALGGAGKFQELSTAANEIDTTMTFSAFGVALGIAWSTPDATAVTVSVQVSFDLRGNV